MKKSTGLKSRIFALSLFISVSVISQQKVIQLYNGTAPGSENWDWTENEMVVNNPPIGKIIYNVTKPTLTVFTPDSANGTAVIICPGGGFHVLNIEREGINVAKELTKKGITVFVFKYRLVECLTNDPWLELKNSMANADSFQKKTAVAKSMAVTDLNMAIAYLQQHATAFNIDTSRIGVIGFSAGGVLATDVAYNFIPKTKPGFVAIIYPGISNSKKPTVKTDAPPLFLAAASDDPLAAESTCVNIYNDWLTAKRPVELHLYLKGGHGLRGMPAQSWITRFEEWLDVQGFLKAK